MRKVRISFVERKFDRFVSVEKVFRLMAAALDPSRFETSFRKLKHLNNLSGMLLNLLTFRRGRDADIYHVTGHCHYIALVLPPERTVLTIHDLGFLHTRSGLRRAVLKKVLLEWPIRRLRYITAISEATRAEIERNVRGSRGRVRVIENPLDPELANQQVRGFNRDEPNILQIGTAANKNLPNLIRAIEGLSCRLTIIGPVVGEVRQMLDAAGIKYQAHEELADGGIKAEYEKADIVAFCSTYEGFGLPIIEGQAMGRPVVTSGLSPMREVAGEGGASFADPNDPADIRDAILALINDEGFRKRTVEAGAANVRRFAPERIAAEYGRLYEEIAANADARRS